MKRAVPGILFGVALALGPVPTGAQAPDPFAAVADADPMVLARLVDRLGDDAVVSRLSAETPPSVRLTAVRAAPWMSEPERSLTALVEIAAGRHPRLAPAAARATLDIARRLAVADLPRREVSPEELSSAAVALRALAADETARPDLRAAAGLAEPLLRALLTE